MKAANIFIKGLPHVIVLLLFLLTSCSPSQTEATFNNKYSTESAVLFIQMAKEAQQGIMPDSTSWKTLFATEGYHQFFMECRDSLWWQQKIQNAFSIAFDTSNQAQLDSILAKPTNMESNMFIINFANLKNRLNEVEEFLLHTNFSELFERANEHAKTFLPARFVELKPVFNNFHFVEFDPESRILNNKVFIGLNGFYEEGEQGMMELIAHELHHSYLEALLDDKYHDTKDPLFHALVDLQAEGIADVITKHSLPVTNLGLYPQDLADLYNQICESTPELLKEMDELVVAYAEGEAEEAQYKRVRQLISAHPGGDYMVFLIKDQLGLQAAIDVCGDIPAFIHCYNEAAAQADSYVFSESFVAYIEKLCKKIEKQA